MVWKKVNNADAGDSTHYGGNDIDKFSDLFSGVSNVDTVDINSNTTFRDQKFRARNPANTFSYILATSAISNNRIATLPLLSGNDTFAFTSHTQTLSNKTFDFATVDFGGTVAGAAGDPTAQRWGAYQPLGAGTSNSTVGILDGLLAGHTGTGSGTPSNSWNSTEGFLVNHTTGSTSGNIAGLASPSTVGIFRRERSTSAKVRWQASTTTSSRLYMGFSSLSTLPASDTPLGATDHGIIVGFSSADTNFTARSNDGATSATSTGLGVAKNANFNTMEISWSSGGSINVALNGVDTAISSDLPGSTTNLFFHCQIQTATTSGRTVAIKGVWVTAAAG